MGFSLIDIDPFATGNVLGPNDANKDGTPDTVAQKADPGSDLSGLSGGGGNGIIASATGKTGVTPGYWDQYGQGAQQQVQTQNAAYQSLLNSTAEQAGQAGQATNQALQQTGQNSANTGTAAQQQLSQQGSQYAGQMMAGGNQYAAQQQMLGGNAQNYALGGGANAAQQGNALSYYGQNAGNQLSQYGQLAGGAVSGMGSDLYSQGGNAESRNINGRERGQIEGLERQQGPSAAQAQLAQATNANQANALAMARSGRGFGGSASAMSQASNQRVGIQQEAANQSAMLRAQEDAAWRQRQAANLQAGANMGAQQAGINDQHQAQLYQMGMSGMESGAQLGMQGMQGGAQLGMQGIQGGANLGLQGSELGMQGYGTNIGATQGAANTYLGALGQAAGTQMGATQAGAGLQMQGYGQQGQQVAAGGQLAQQGYGTQGNLYGNAGNYGLNNQNVQSSLVNQAYGIAQQHQQNAINATAANNGTALQQQQMSNQQTGGYLSMLGSALPMVGAIASDRNVKEGIEPSNVTLSADLDKAKTAGTDFGGTIVMPEPGTATGLDEGQGYDPFSQGTGISGPNQAQGSASSGASQAASGEQTAIRDQSQHASAMATAKQGSQDALHGGYGMGGTQLTPLGALGNAMKTGATNAMGDLSVNPVTGRPYEQNSGYQIYQPQQQPGMLPMQQVTSDEREKEAMRTFDETPGYSYNYKDPDAMGSTHGRQFGLMAQDLEKTPAGASVVKEVNGTKMVDTSRLALVEGAALNGALKRIAELEKRLGAGKSKAA